MSAPRPLDLSKRSSTTPRTESLVCPLLGDNLSCVRLWLLTPFFALRSQAGPAAPLLHCRMSRTHSALARSRLFFLHRSPTLLPTNVHLELTPHWRRIRSSRPFQLREVSQPSSSSPFALHHRSTSSSRFTVPTSTRNPSRDLLLINGIPSLLPLFDRQHRVCRPSVVSINRYSHVWMGRKVSLQGLVGDEDGKTKI